MPDEPTRLELFAEHLKQEVRIKCEPDTGTPPLMEEAFTGVVIERPIEHNEAGDFALCAWEDQSRGKLPAAKLSAWSLSGDGATLDLFVSLHHNDEAPTLVPRAEADQHFKLLRGFLNDNRTIMGMAVRMGKNYPANSGGWIVSHVAALDWERLKMKPGFGPKKLREIVELFTLAATKLPPAK